MDAFQALVQAVPALPEDLGRVVAGLGRTGVGVVVGVAEDVDRGEARSQKRGMAKMLALGAIVAAGVGGRG